MPVERLNRIQLQNEEQLSKLEAIFIHPHGWEEKWNEWIFIDSNTKCLCDEQCKTDRTMHRIAPLNTQTAVKKLKWVGFHEYMVCFCKGKCTNVHHKIRSMVPD